MVNIAMMMLALLEICEKMMVVDPKKLFPFSKSIVEV